MKSVMSKPRGFPGEFTLQSLGLYLPSSPSGKQRVLDFILMNITDPGLLLGAFQTLSAPER